jgi:transposase-like protein
MRHFRCSDCSHEWDVPFGTGTSGIQMTRPKCASSNVHRVNGGRGRGPAATGRGRAKQEGARGGSHETLN